ncbi:hypothetical protein OG520_04160 [Streptomyces sp. NBC_00984]|uniref:hypothetical protein n=1 Tax=Streptomyces sp. NBC_00984 TaxID=2903700 RepID=UPI00386C43CA|nr:hypothetical protein OG520_04160 [Streptomyces sp. NBC_00984]
MAGHDRGARCAYRPALDHRDRVGRLAVLDIVPTADALDAVDAPGARQLWRWFLMAQPYPVAERMIAGDPETFLFGAHARLFAPEALAAYRAAATDPAVVHAMCEARPARSVLQRHRSAKSQHGIVPGHETFRRHSRHLPESIAILGGRGGRNQSLRML